MHGLPEWTQISIFYNSVNTPTRMILDASANGTLLDKPPREGLEILEKLGLNDYQHPTTRRGSMRSSLPFKSLKPWISSMKSVAATTILLNVDKTQNQAAMLVIRFPARSDQPWQVKEAAVIRSCVEAARTKDPELTQAGNSSTCRSTHLGRRGKYNRECDKISIFFQQTLDQERTKSRPKTICKTNPKPKHTKSTWSISLSREKSCFIKIT
ncbi:hypothetical protein V6N12_035504 [Hibiscus sabdariffa]|uniref:Uncharacterized protein n=1 Tax=Hibiscus sabdariffa TaxID=183260 RepID=A0ABR2ERT8_9ROSI